MRIHLYFQAYVTTKDNSIYFEDCLKELEGYQYSTEPVKSIYIPISEDELVDTYDGIVPVDNGEQLLAVLNELEVCVSLSDFTLVDDVLDLVGDSVTSYALFDEVSLNAPRV